MKIDKEVFELQASICQTMANAKRLEIISILGERELAVSDLADKMEVKISNLSQHLSIMKNKGILTSRRDGVHIYYRIANPKVIKACCLMKEVMTELLEEQGKLSKMV